MKKIIILLSFLSLLSCSSEQPQQKATNVRQNTEEEKQYIHFQRYLHSLNNLPLPFHYNQDLDKYIRNFDKKEFARFKHSYTHMPVGILFKDNNSIVTIENQAADVALPYLLSYDNDGNKIDSLCPYKNSVVDMGYASIEYLTIYKDKTISVIDSIWEYDLNEGQTNIVKESERLTVTTTQYEITPRGKFLKK